MVNASSKAFCPNEAGDDVERDPPFHSKVEKWPISSSVIGGFAYHQLSPLIRQSRLASISQVILKEHKN